MELLAIDARDGLLEGRPVGSVKGCHHDQVRPGPYPAGRESPSRGTLASARPSAVNVIARARPGARTITPALSHTSSQYVTTEVELNPVRFISSRIVGG